MTATPNGYFGDGTFSAVKKYQKSVGLSQSGGVLPLTRAAIQKETCFSSIPTVAVVTTSAITPSNQFLSPPARLIS